MLCILCSLGQILSRAPTVQLQRPTASEGYVFRGVPLPQASGFRGVRLQRRPASEATRETAMPPDVRRRLCPWFRALPHCANDVSLMSKNLPLIESQKSLRWQRDFET